MFNIEGEVGIELGLESKENTYKIEKGLVNVGRKRVRDNTFITTNPNVYKSFRRNIPLNYFLQSLDNKMILTDNSGHIIKYEKR